MLALHVSDLAVDIHAATDVIIHNCIIHPIAGICWAVAEVTHTFAPTICEIADALGEFAHGLGGPWWEGRHF